ncbi:MAG TPA: 6-phosphogluconolactonase [Candidatus Limnocylindrales bacterium]|nr:6-phosphogluconolactonase [Candidatus Limnocylindrales bacterium]
MTEPELIVLPDPDACAAAAAERVATILRDAVAARGRAHWSTTGGSTPAPIYHRLAEPPLRDVVPWSQVELWWGDERFVPADHPLSNAKIALADLLEAGAYGGQSGTGAAGVDVAAGRTTGAPVPAENVHPIPTGEAIGRGLDPEWAAERYAEMLRTDGPPTDGGWPVFDLVLLGIGPDGHIMSVFPGSEAFEISRVALAIPAPTHVEPHVERVTLHPRVIDVARSIVVVVTGAGKAAVLADVLGSEPEPRRLPAQVARRAGAAWIVDEAAAANLRR